MPKAKMSDDEWITFLKDCRSSGMTDKDWCIMHDIHPSTLYKVISRLRKKACEIPTHENKTVSLRQEVVEVASIDENGVITQPSKIETVPAPSKSPSVMPYSNTTCVPAFETTVRVAMPSGINIGFSNSTNAATIRSILGALQSV